MWGQSCGIQPAQLLNGSISTYTTDNLATGTWEKIASIKNPNASIFDNNPGFLTDQYGNITPFISKLFTFFGHGWCWDIKSWSLYMASGDFTVHTGTTGSTAPMTSPFTGIIVSASSTSNVAGVSGSNKNTTSHKFSRNLHFGSRGNDITELQKILNKDLNLNPPLPLTGYFSSKTQKAVEQFQEKYKIARKGDPGYGFVGPKTRGKLNPLLR